MSSNKTKLLIAALVLVLLLLTATTCVVVFVVLPARQTADPHPADPHPAGASTLVEVRDQDVAGRYKMTDGNKESFIVLYADHSFMNEDGTTYPQYRWEVTPGGFSITWQRTTTVFPNREAAGVYTGVKGNGAPLRLEKLPPRTAAELVVPAPIAFIRFGTQCQTNGLLPVNTEGDGSIVPDTTGAEAWRLARPAGKNDAYLYLQIAPELKQPPFTNALVIVEFFDRASPVGRPGRLLVQYDDERGGPFLNSQPLPLNGSDTWQEATFYLPTPLFQNRQDGGGDFRLNVNRSELAIRSVKLVKNAPLPESKMPSVTQR